MSVTRDKGVASCYAEVLATKGAPLCRQSWENKAKSRPIDRPHLATPLPSATGRTTLGQEGAIVFGRANINLPGKHSPAEPVADLRGVPIVPRILEATPTLGGKTTPISIVFENPTSPIDLFLNEFSAKAC